MPLPKAFIDRTGLKAAWLCCCILLLVNLNLFAQPFQYHDSASLQVIEQRKQAALQLLANFDTTKRSAYWPNINPSWFIINVRHNVNHPTKINQGNATNFCGYAAFSHILLTYLPETYVHVILDLYWKGEAKLPKKHLKPTEEVLNRAGMLSGKGELDVQHADQLWFLTLADQFKGYLNAFDHKYQPGDENLIWAATNFGKFNRMLQVFGNYKVHASGSDLIRPWKGNYYDFLTKQQQNGLVMIYLNSKLLHPSKHSLFKLRAPTHFVVLYRLQRHDDLITFQYWDYGLRTQQIIPAKRFHKLIFGISVIKKD